MTEQEKFEAWYFPPARNQFMTEKNPDGTYVDSGTMFSWAAWQAAIASREPMTQKQISESVEDQDELRSFIRGINVAERFHGI